MEKLTKDDERLIVALAGDGLWASEIAKKFECTTSEILHVCQRLCVQVKTKVLSHKNIDADIKRLLKDGRTFAECRDATGCSLYHAKQVNKTMKRADVYKRRVKECNDKFAVALELVKNGATVLAACRQTNLAPSSFYARRPDLTPKESTYELFLQAQKLVNKGQKVAMACLEVGLSTSSYNRRRQESAPY